MRGDAEQIAVHLFVCLFPFQDLSVAICWSSDYTYFKSLGLGIYLTTDGGAKGKHTGGSFVAKTLQP